MLQERRKYAIILKNQGFPVNAPEKFFAFRRENRSTIQKEDTILC